MTRARHTDVPLMIDLSTWNLTLPQGRPPLTIATARLASDYQSDYFRRTPDGVVFWAPVNGSHTSNSEYPRTELRETQSNGKPFNWRYARMDSQLRASLRIDTLPSSRRVVIGQIHSDGWGSGDAAPLVKLVYQLRLDQGRILAQVRSRPDDATTKEFTVLDGIPMGRRFSYRLGVSHEGVLSISVNDQKLTQQLDPQWANQGLYFKAGVYLQDNRGPVSEGGQATFSELSIHHQ
ncbi:MAG: hypothetical protein GAK43_00519 [Stenotrophomonas maltophilia]|nr:MAG: hypothetical protein GAK43_00519 [Stenotrophomonas maltophilia]